MDLDRSTAQRLVREVDPALVVKDVVALVGGGNSAVFDVACSGPFRHLVVKVYSDAFHWKMGKEAFLYGLIETHVDVPAPRVLRADDSKELVPQNYVVMTKLEGRTLYSLLTEIGEHDLVDLYRQIATILRALHRITFEAFGYIGTSVLEPHATNLAYMSFQFEKKLREFAELGGDAGASSCRRALRRFPRRPVGRVRDARSLPR